jgi:hypothetical protein
MRGPAAPERRRPARRLQTGMGAQPREGASGRFGFAGHFERLCRCEHALGVHASEAPHPCSNEDRFVEGATGEKCGCERFRWARQPAVRSEGGAL